MGGELNHSSAWEDYYNREDKEISANRIESVKQIHRKYLDVLLNQDKLIATEIGIGTGTMGYTLSCLAQERGKALQVIELDYSYKLLQDAKSFNGQTGINYIQADTFALPFTEEIRDNHLIFNQGLLEHFSNEEIQIMVSEQLRVADTVIATVPSYKYTFTQGLRGDERLLSLEQWVSILNPVAAAEGFYYGLNDGEEYHICLVIKSKE